MQQIEQLPKFRPRVIFATKQLSMSSCEIINGSVPLLFFRFLHSIFLSEQINCTIQHAIFFLITNLSYKSAQDLPNRNEYMSGIT
jgi:hypothetical protein